MMIIPGTPEDRDAILEIIEKSFPAEFGEAWNARQLESMLALPSVETLLARQDHRLSGFAISRTIFDECELLLIAVDPEFRRMGVGGLLLGHMISQSRDALVAKVFLEMREGNIAQALYSKFGFKPIGRRAQYYRGNDGECHDAVTLAVIL